VSVEFEFGGITRDRNVNFSKLASFHSALLIVIPRDSLLGQTQWTGSYNGNAIDLHSEDVRLQSRMGNQLSWLNLFSQFSSVLPENVGIALWQFLSKYFAIHPSVVSHFDAMQFEIMIAS
jgi:hypothetical protein